MADREKVIKGLELCAIGSECAGRNCPYWHNVIDDAIKQCDCTTELVRDVLALLKEQEANERKWLQLWFQTIADNQIAIAPKDSPMSLDEQLESEYKSGISEGMLMGFEILTEGRRSGSERVNNQS